jgi:hypothetical protein
VPGADVRLGVVDEIPVFRDFAAWVHIHLGHGTASSQEAQKLECGQDVRTSCEALRIRRTVLPFHIRPRVADVPACEHGAEL